MLSGHLTLDITSLGRQVLAAKLKLGAASWETGLRNKPDVELANQRAYNRELKSLPQATTNHGAADGNGGTWQARPRKTSVGDFGLRQTSAAENVQLIPKLNRSRPSRRRRRRRLFLDPDQSTLLSPI